jgi:hypothetical protein
MKVAVCFKEKEQVFDDYDEALEFIDNLLDNVPDISDTDIEIKYL